MKNIYRFLVISFIVLCSTQFVIARDKITQVSNPTINQTNSTCIIRFGPICFKSPKDSQPILHIDICDTNGTILISTNEYKSSKAKENYLSYNDVFTIQKFSRTTARKTGLSYSEHKINLYLLRCLIAHLGLFDNQKVIDIRVKMSFHTGDHSKKAIHEFDDYKIVLQKPETRLILATSAMVKENRPNQAYEVTPPPVTIHFPNNKDYVLETRITDAKGNPIKNKKGQPLVYYKFWQQSGWLNIGCQPEMISIPKTDVDIDKDMRLTCQFELKCLNDQSCNARTHTISFDYKKPRPTSATVGSFETKEEGFDYVMQLHNINIIEPKAQTYRICVWFKYENKYINGQKGTSLCCPSGYLTVQGERFTTEWDDVHNDTYILKIPISEFYKTLKLETNHKTISIDCECQIICTSTGKLVGSSHTTLYHTNLFCRTMIKKAKQAREDKDHKTMAKWYGMAARCYNDAAAQYYYAMALYDGYGVEKNREESTKWYRKAAEQNYAPAQLNYGKALEDGIGETKNLYAAEKWYLKSYENGYIDSAFRLYLLYKYDLENKEKAIYWLKKYADNNYCTHWITDKEVDDSTLQGVEWLSEMGVYYRPSRNSSKYWFNEALAISKNSMTGYLWGLSSAIRYFDIALSKTNDPYTKANIHINQGINYFGIIKKSIDSDYDNMDYDTIELYERAAKRNFEEAIIYAKESKHVEALKRATKLLSELETFASTLKGISLFYQYH